SSFWGSIKGRSRLRLVKKEEGNDEDPTNDGYARVGCGNESLMELRKRKQGTVGATVTKERKQWFASDRKRLRMLRLLQRRARLW
ncbi:hypothetical protein GW17_00056959, partial [Ensete ventricosum]